MFATAARARNRATDLLDVAATLVALTPASNGDTMR
jgi:hypothetical protein